MKSMNVNLLDFREDIEVNLHTYEVYVLGLISKQVPRGLFIRFVQMLKNGKCRTDKWTGQIPG